MSYDLFVDTGHSIMYVGYGLLNKEYVTSHGLYCERLTKVAPRFWLRLGRLGKAKSIALEVP